MVAAQEKLTPAIDVHDLTVAYARKPVIWDIDCAIPHGSLTAIAGPNGAGKSTLLKAILGLVPPISGHALVLGEPIEKVRHRVGYVPQRESVDWDFPVSVLDVVLMGTYGRVGWIRRPGKRERAFAEECLEKVGLMPFRDRQISHLSGGQQQRVFVARALAQDSDVYLLDEPFAGVDAATEAAILKVLRELRSAGKTIVAVHHDLQTVSQYFDHAVLLNVHIIAAGKIADVFTAENLQKTYGGRLTLGEELAESMQRGEKR